MKYKILLITISLFAVIGTSVFATDGSATSTSALIDQLKQQIANLNTQIIQLQNQLNVIKEAEKQIKETSLQLKTQLKEGMSGEDVKLLQEFLASDPEIYPEGKITGYFGSLTKKAIQKFQKKACISSVGNVGPQTIRRINELLSEGAGKSGHIPAGLLRASGLQKKLCGTSTSTPDTIAPVISAVSATEISTSTAKIIWTTNESSDSKIYYNNLTPINVSATSTSNVIDTSLVTSHSLGLTGLTSTTTYYYFVVSKDSSGNTATSSESSFVILP